MKTEEKLAFQKGILEGLKLVEKMYKSGDLNPGNLIKLMEVHDDQLNYLEYVLELEQKRQPITSALADTNVGNMPPPPEKPIPPRASVDMAGQIIQQQVTDRESIGIPKVLYVLFYVVVLVASIFFACLTLVKPWIYGLR